MDVVIERFAVYLVSLDPAVGSEMRKTRPCTAISPDSMHQHLHTVVIVPLTSGRTGWPTRVPCEFQGRPGEIALDQMRSVDRRRLVKRVGDLDSTTIRSLSQSLLRFFA